MTAIGKAKAYIGFLSFGVLFSVPTYGAAIVEFATYTFEAPKFTLNETTSMLDRAPNSAIGALAATLLTTFTSAPGTGDLSISSTATVTPNTLFTGQFLFSSAVPSAVLTMNFNMPVSSIELDFAIATLSGGGFLRITTLSGSVDQPAVQITASSFFGGHVNFTPATSFTGVQIQGFSAPGTPQLFATDNVKAGIVPEPTTWSMLALGVVAFSGARLRGIRAAGRRRA
jgi:hypothetical protein